MPRGVRKDGLKMPLEQRMNISKGRVGENNNWWKGGITHWRRAFKNTFEYKEFRRNVLERDNKTCVLCGSNEKVCVDHIKSFSLYPELRTVVENGRTLCYQCHYKTKTFGRNVPPEFCSKCPHCVT